MDITQYFIDNRRKVDDIYIWANVNLELGLQLDTLLTLWNIHQGTHIAIPMYIWRQELCLKGWLQRSCWVSTLRTAKPQLDKIPIHEIIFLISRSTISNAIETLLIGGS